MLDHVFLTVPDLDRSIAFYTAALAPLGITSRLDYDGKDGPPGHPDLTGFGANGRVFFWLRQGTADARAAHVGFIANDHAAVDAAYAAAMAAGATDNSTPAERQRPSTSETPMQDLINRLIAATNAFDVEAAMALFAPDAVIADVSVGDTFAGTTGVRNYIEQFFVGYNTASKLLSIETDGDRHAIARLDFTGSFGHETGFLDIVANPDGLIEHIDADLD